MNLRRKRHDQHMTQEELAERAGLSARYVGAIERGDVSASVTVLGQISEALGVEPGDLLRRSSRKGRAAALRADQGPDILQQHEQMHGIAGRRDEIEAFVEGPRLIILGVDSEGPKAGDLGRRERPGERVLQKTGPDPFSRPSAGDREAREDHQGNRMPGDALAQPLRRIFVRYVPERQRVEADNLVFRESQISLRAVGKLALQGEADQEAVQRFLAAIEPLDAMIAPQLLDAERHLFGRRLLEHAGFGQKPLKPRQRPGWCIERSQKRLPARRVEPKMLTIG